MKVKLIESAGKPLDKLRRNIENMFNYLPEGFDIHKARTLDKNKFMSYYYGTYNNKPLTLIVNTTNPNIEDDQDIFFSILENGIQVPLGGAKASDSHALNDLFTFYFNDKKEEARHQEEQKKQQEEKDRAEKEQRNKEREEELARDEENRRIEEENELKALKLEYKQLTGEDLPDGIDSGTAHVKLMQAQFINDIPNFITELSNSEYQSNMTVSYKNSDPNLEGYFDIVKYTKDQFSIEDKRPRAQSQLSVVNKDKLNNILTSEITEHNSLPGMVNIRTKNNDAIDSKIYM